MMNQFYRKSNELGPTGSKIGQSIKSLKYYGIPVYIYNLLETNAFVAIFGFDWEVERFSANEQTFEFIKNIRLMRNNTNNKLKIVLHKVESWFPYCANWKEMYRSKYK